MNGPTALLQGDLIEDNRNEAAIAEWIGKHNRYAVLQARDEQRASVNDLDNISSTLQQNLTQLITSLLSVTGIMIMMFTIDWRMTLVVLLTLPLSVTVVTTIAKRSQAYFIRQQKSLGELNGHVAEMYSGHTIVTAFGHEERSVAKFNELNERYYEGAWKAQFATGMIFPIMMFVGNIGYVAVAVLGRGPAIEARWEGVPYSLGLSLMLLSYAVLSWQPLRRQHRAWTTAVLLAPLLRSIFPL